MSNQVSVFPPELLLLLFTKYSTHEVVPVIRLVCKSLWSDMKTLHRFITSSTTEVLLEAITSHHDEFTLRMCMVLKRFDVFYSYSVYYDFVHKCELKRINYAKYVDAVNRYDCEGFIYNSLNDVDYMYAAYRYRSYADVCVAQIWCAWRLEEMLNDNRLEQSDFEYQPQLFEWLAGKRISTVCTPKNMIVYAKRGMMKTYIWCERQRRRFNAIHRKGKQRKNSLKGIAKQAIIWTIKHNYLEFTQYLMNTYGFADDKNSPFYQNLLRIKDSVLYKNLEFHEKQIFDQ
jgi:hypothetical protein